MLLLGSCSSFLPVCSSEDVKHIHIFPGLLHAPHITVSMPVPSSPQQRSVDVLALGGLLLSELSSPHRGGCVSQKVVLFNFLLSLQWQKAATKAISWACCWPGHCDGWSPTTPSFYLQNAFSQWKTLVKNTTNFPCVAKRTEFLTTVLTAFTLPLKSKFENVMNRCFCSLFEYLSGSGVRSVCSGDSRAQPWAATELGERYLPSQSCTAISSRST